jgi:hypothetical protein
MPIWIRLSEEGIMRLKYDKKERAAWLLKVDF